MQHECFSPECRSRHSKLGIAALVTLSVQPILAALRPKEDVEGTRSAWLTRRAAWKAAHRIIALAALAAGAVALLSGVNAACAWYFTDCRKLHAALAAWLTGLAALLVVREAVGAAVWLAKAAGGAFAAVRAGRGDEEHGGEACCRLRVGQEEAAAGASCNTMLPAEEGAAANAPAAAGGGGGGPGEKAGGGETDAWWWGAHIPEAAAAERLWLMVSGLWLLCTAAVALIYIQ